MKGKRLCYLVVLHVLALLSAPVFAKDASTSTADALYCNNLPFVYNNFRTTAYGPAGADIMTSQENMLPCSGGSYALCYYSGPAPMPCKVDKEKNVAICQCYGYESEARSYKYFVDINAILNTCVYIETVRACGHGGSQCTSENSAPVCQYISQTPQSFMPQADLISTFSLAKVPDYGPPGCTPCNGLYAGCMTAPCHKQQNEKGETVVLCECPLYNGPYQVGQNHVQCGLGDGLVWSAAYNTNGCPVK